MRLLVISGNPAPAMVLESAGHEVDELRPATAALELPDEAPDVAVIDAEREITVLRYLQSVLSTDPDQRDARQHQPGDAQLGYTVRSHVGVGALTD